MFEEDDPPKPQRRVAMLPLDSLGVDELRSYIAELQLEIARVEAVIDRKLSHLGIAESLFRR